MFTDIKKKKGKDRDLKNDSKRIEAEQKDLSYISLILPQSLGFSRPRRKGFLFHLFWSRVGYLYTDWCGCRCLRGEP